MKKVIISLSVIGVAAAAIIGGTIAYFSDTETSTGNVFTAGAIDLKIDNESYLVQNGEVIRMDENSWGIEDGDLDAPDHKLFFNFTDLKPGDLGEDTISLHVNSNDAWACMAIDITDTPENECTEPEESVDSNCEDPDGGELQDELYFAFWADDGDNVYETDEVIFKEGLAGEIFDGAFWALADSQTNVWEAENVPLEGGVVGQEPIVYYVGKVWCYGELQEDAKDPQTDGDPVARGTGFLCNGEPVTNVSQTDGIMADVTFYAEQARNNGQFICGEQEEQGPTVGANLGNYSAPQDCNVYVDDEGDLQAAINGASDGSTVCVNDGDYNGVTINKPLILAAVNGPVNTAVINGGVRIASSDVTIKGFKVIPGYWSGTYAGFYLDTNNVGNIVISDNDIDGTTQTNTDRGIETLYGGVYGAITITNNEIHGVVTGVYENPHTGSIFQITYNDIYDTTAGIGGFNHSNVAYNEFRGSGNEAIGADSSYVDGVANYNNFLDGTRINDYGAVPTINAENNFFNNGGINQTTANEVDYDPESVAQYAHN